MPKDGRQRLDKWLFFVRLQKSRTLAAKLIAAEKVRVNRNKISDPAHQIRVGDVLTISFERVVRVLRVEGLGDHRGPFAEAQLLYSDLAALDQDLHPVEAPSPEPDQPSKPERH